MDNITKNSLLKLKNSKAIPIIAHTSEMIIPVAYTGVVKKFLDEKNISLPLSHQKLQMLKAKASQMKGEPNPDEYARGGVIKKKKKYISQKQKVSQRVNIKIEQPKPKIVYRRKKNSSLDQETLKDKSPSQIPLISASPFSQIRQTYAAAPTIPFDSVAEQIAQFRKQLQTVPDTRPIAPVEIVKPPVAQLVKPVDNMPVRLSGASTAPSLSPSELSAQKQIIREKFRPAGFKPQSKGSTASSGELQEMISGTLQKQKQTKAQKKAVKEAQKAEVLSGAGLLEARREPYIPAKGAGSQIGIQKRRGRPPKK